MRLELLKDVWIKLQLEFEKRLENAETVEEEAVYQYLLEQIIPSEIEFIETDDEYETELSEHEDDFQGDD
jgi:hypothetical protein